MMDQGKQKPMCAIRNASIEDAALLASLGREAFLRTFGDQNTPEDMALYLNASFGEAIQSAEIRQPGSLFLIAEIEGQPAGYARLLSGSMDTCIKGRQVIELVRLYAMERWIGKGIGSALMQACLEEGRQQGHDVIWLGVWEKNQRAIAFYQRWGFEVVGTHVFMLGEDIQTDFIMQRNLE
jgi:ribosomal protein S18 acetylase RimI-like enzyme